MSLLRNRAFALTLAIAAGIGAGASADEPPPLAPATASDVADHREKVLMRHLWPVLRAEGKSARIYFNATCAPNSHNTGHILALPHLTLRAPRKGKAGLAAVQDILREERGAAITESGSIIRIRVGEVQDEVLQTRISKVAFDKMEQYSDILAVIALEGTKEVSAAMSRLKIRVATELIEVLSSAGGDLPHIPAELANVTMDEALDTIANTYKNVIFYGICAKESVFDISVSGGVYFDEDWLRMP